MMPYLAQQDQGDDIGGVEQEDAVDDEKRQEILVVQLSDALIEPSI